MGESEAIQIAEKFIADNGYTNLPPVKDKAQLSYETIEWYSNQDELLKQRYDTLKPKAYGVARNRKGGVPGWTVIFQYKNANKKNGRAVTMDINGRNVRVEHVDFILAKVEKKLTH